MAPLIAEERCDGKLGLIKGLKGQDRRSQRGIAATTKGLRCRRNGVGRATTSGGEPLVWEDECEQSSPESKNPRNSSAKEAKARGLCLLGRRGP